MKKLAYVLYALLALAVAGLLVWDYVPDHSIDPSTVSRAAVLLAGIALGILKIHHPRRRSVSNKKALYSNAYAKYIQNVFPEDKKAEKLFFNAVDDYNQDRPADGLDKLTRLRGECRNSAERYAVTVFTALCLDDMKLYEKAAEQYRAALQIRQESSLASNLALALDRAGKPDEALPAYELAIHLDPENPNPLNNLAQRFIRGGDYAQGLEYAKKALAINPKMPQALNAMAICSYMLGNQADYELYYRQAVSNGSDGKKLKAFIHSLDPAL